MIAANAPAASAEPSPADITVAAADGRGRSVSPGRSCSDGEGAMQGTGAYWHYEYGAGLAPGQFSALASEALVHLNLHSDTERYQNVDGIYPDGTNPSAFLQGNESHVSLLNDRGSVKIRLRSGTCSAPTLAFDGSVASGAGTWEIESGAGAYRDITGVPGADNDGTFELEAEVNPGADNALTLNLDGTFDLPVPSLDVSVVRTYWGSLGSDYLTRRVSVVYRVTNAGPGDAFGSVVQAITSEPGARPMISPPIPLGDLQEGASVDITVRHQLALRGEPCNLVILGCTFDTVFLVNLPDALDRPHVLSDVVTAEAPVLPPPL